MNKKILAIGSIIACIVIVIAGLSPVVGYNSVESSAKESPLFGIRTRRAINEEQEGLIYNYLRKGELMPFPTRDGGNIITQRVLDRISKMNDNAFNKFIDLVIHYLGKSQDIDTQEIIKTLHQIRESPSDVKIHISDGEDNRLATEGCPYDTLGGNWIPECWRDVLWFIINVVVLAPIWIILGVIAYFIGFLLEPYTHRLTVYTYCEPGCWI